MADNRDNMTYTLKQARMLRGKTQREIADYIGVCRDTYRSIEADPERATVSQAYRICAFLQMPLERISFTRDST